MAQAPRIAIIGAGIAGLTTALCLARIGLSPVLFERAETLDEVGAGLQLSPNALSVMAELGLLPALRRVAVEAGHVELRDLRSGRRIAAVPVRSGDGTPYFSIHRADLQAVLLAAVRDEPSITLRLGAELAGLEAVGGMVALSLRGEDRPQHFALAIGADGVRSAMAGYLQLSPPQAAGTTAWRSTISVDETGNMATAAALSGNDGTDGGPGAVVGAWLGTRHHAVAYPIRAGRAVNLVLVTKDSESGDPASVTSLFESRDRRLSALIGAAPTPTGWPLLATPADRPFVHAGGRIVLVGDAAHAMEPYAAQGAAMAIEDAAVLARALGDVGGAAIEAGRIEAAARRYEAERRPRIAQVRKRVSFHRFVYHLPPPLAFGRDAVLKLRPSDALRADLAWLYDWRAPKLGPPPAG
ncbi:FAD-dependent monooxygenase [Jiella sp. KSK16Y-1]|uniref:FAD-dependent monooxygenase n=1 Tax=Jiella mangrovi TaxID=2821407 RepID=A0ABS4BIA6_9HYPH|nr:FAD-dependent monooxygenase [Jiella mangrovi]